MNVEGHDPSPGRGTASRTIWIYWENPPGQAEPPHIALCRRLMIANCPNCSVVLVTPENLHDYLPDISERINQIGVRRGKVVKPSLAIKCAFIRAELIHRYGGLYIDSDCIVFQDLSQVFELLEQYDFVAMRRTSGGKDHVSIGFYASRAGGEVMSRYTAQLRAILAERTGFAWGEAGARTITPIVDSALDICYLYPERRVHPIVAEEKELFLAPASEFAKYMDADPLTFMLFHRLFEFEELVNADEEHLTAGDTVLSEAFRVAGRKAIANR
jgi:hypothetical protein